MSGFVMSFNPRPALMPGESHFAHLFICAFVQFQSTPGINAGRIHGAYPKRHMESLVSIHARH